MSEPEDEADSKSADRKIVGVQIPPGAPKLCMTLMGSSSIGGASDFESGGCRIVPYLPNQLCPCVGMVDDADFGEKGTKPYDGANPESPLKNPLIPKGSCPFESGRGHQIYYLTSLGDTSIVVA